MPHREPRPLRLGLTGGIGSGKSTVGHMLRGAGCRADRRGPDCARGHGAARGRDAGDPRGVWQRFCRWRNRRAGPRTHARPRLQPAAGSGPSWRPSCTRWSRAQRPSRPSKRMAEDTAWSSLTSRCWWSRAAGRARLDAVLVVDCSAETQIARVHAPQRSGTRTWFRPSSRRRPAAARAGRRPTPSLPTTWTARWRTARPRCARRPHCSGYDAG